VPPSNTQRKNTRRRHPRRTRLRRRIPKIGNLRHTPRPPLQHHPRTHPLGLRNPTNNHQHHHPRQRLANHNPQHQTNPTRHHQIDAISGEHKIKVEFVGKRGKRKTGSVRRRKPMRKLICVLITLTFAFPSLSTAATKKKVKPKPDKYAALKKRVIGFWDEYNRQFQLPDPDTNKLLTFVLPSSRSAYRVEFQRQISDPSRLVEIRDTPIDVKRVIAIKRISSTSTTVDFCWVRSLREVSPTDVIPADKSVIGLEGQRVSQKWSLKSGIWYQFASAPVANYETEEQCAGAK
jgi:hypothetical protein